MNQHLATLAGRYWDTVMEASPSSASILGDHRFDDQMEDATAEAEHALVAAITLIRDQAEAIDPQDLEADEKITRRVLMFEADGVIGEAMSRTAEYLVDPMIGPHMNLINFVPQMQPLTAGHADAYVTKASRVGRFFDQCTDRLRQGIANGRTPPRLAVEKVLGQIDAYLASPIEADPFLRIRPPEGMGDGEIGAWRERMAEQVRREVRPGVGRYRAALADEVLGESRPQEKSGVCWLPDGEEIYQRAIYRYTSLNLGAPEIHQIGLDGIAALEDEYRTLGSTVLGVDDLQEIYGRLRNDPALRFETSEQVKAAAKSALDRATAALDDWFGTQPKAPCVMAEVPEVGAKDAPLAFYLPPAGDGSRPGTFFINTVEPTTRTRYESEALAFHESVPGHHLQLAIAQEVEGLPAFRKNGMVTVYVEGWGLYTERLADEMGLYSGDLERMGILSFDSWRAGRLVVDTGMHALGWSRQQAIDYLSDNSPQAPNNIVNEVDRYIGYTGQALAYKIGQREIFRVRDEAKRLMGARFDIKGFHDVVLEAGPVPLDLLGELVADWAS
ncbi:MAG: DUF885 domain-containing protein [Actinobacteria bacterium]|nr:DUF885 domain-containing protein [Actinomycetota bacterium]